jgi:hypothetical protein
VLVPQASLQPEQRVQRPRELPQQVQASLAAAVLLSQPHLLHLDLFSRSLLRPPLLALVPEDSSGPFPQRLPEWSLSASSFL